MTVTLGEVLAIISILICFGGLLIRVGRRDKTVENNTKIAEDHASQIASLKVALSDNALLTENQHNLICHARQIETEADIKGLQVAVKSLKEAVKDLSRKTDNYQQAANERWEETVKVLAQVCATLEQNQG